MVQAAVAMTLAAHEECVRVARSAYPREGCALLVGTRSKRRVERAVEIPNADQANPTTRFKMDPLAYLRAEREADREGREVVGVFHSHPDGPAEPSERDARFAEGWPGWWWAIASVSSGGVGSFRVWSWPGPQEVRLEVDPDRLRRRD